MTTGVGSSSNSSHSSAFRRIRVVHVRAVLVNGSRGGLLQSAQVHVVAGSVVHVVGVVIVFTGNLVERASIGSPPRAVSGHETVFTLQLSFVASNLVVDILTFDQNVGVLFSDFVFDVRRLGSHLIQAHNQVVELAAALSQHRVVGQGIQARVVVLIARSLQEPRAVALLERGRHSKRTLQLLGLGRRIKIVAVVGERIGVLLVLLVSVASAQFAGVVYGLLVGVSNHHAEAIVSGKVGNEVVQVLAVVERGGRTRPGDQVSLGGDGVLVHRIDLQLSVDNRVGDANVRFGQRFVLVVGGYQQPQAARGVRRHVAAAVLDVGEHALALADQLAQVVNVEPDIFAAAHDDYAVVCQRIAQQAEVVNAEKVLGRALGVRRVGDDHVELVRVGSAQKLEPIVDDNFHAGMAVELGHFRQVFDRQVDHHVVDFHQGDLVHRAQLHVLDQLADHPTVSSAYHQHPLGAGMRHHWQVRDELAVHKLVLLRAADDAVQHQHVAEAHGVEHKDVAVRAARVEQHLAHLERKRAAGETVGAELVEPVPVADAHHRRVLERRKVDLAFERHRSEICSLAKSTSVMFVFPAFNDSYSKRKRTYKCCAKCRSRRVKCIITSADYEVSGCENCKEIGAVCDLTAKSKQKPPHRAASERSTRSKTSSAANRSFDSPDAPQMVALTSENDTPNASSCPTNSQSKTSSLTPQSASSGHSAPPPMRSPASVVPHPAMVMKPQTDLPMQFSLPQVSYDIPGPFVPHPASFYHYQPQESLEVPWNPQIAYQVPQHTSPLVKQEDAHLRLAPITQTKTDTARPEEYHQGLPRPDLLALQVNSARMTQSPIAKGIFSPFTINQLPGPMTSTPMELDHSFDIKQVTSKYLNDKFGFVIGPAHIRHYKVTFPVKFSDKKSIYADILSDDESEPNAELHIQSKPHFELLLKINAFTLSTPGEYDVSEDDTKRLLQIYFFKINSVLPIIEEQGFWKLYDTNSVSSIVIYCIVLAVSRDALCEPILSQCIKKSAKAYVEHLDEFLTSLEFKIRQLLLIQDDFGCEDKLERVIVHALLSLHFGSHRMGNEQSSQDLFGAISYAEGLSIHMNFVHERLIAENYKDKSDYFKKLWYTLYILDRFNAVMNSKAFVIKDSDFNIGVPEEESEFSQVVSEVQHLQHLIFFVFQPTKADPPPAAEELKRSGRLSLNSMPDELTFFQNKRFSDLTKEEYKRIQYYVLITLIRRLYMIICMAGIAKVDGTYYDVKDGMLKLVFSLRELFETLQHSAVEEIGQKLLINIPFIPSFFSIIYAILVRYKTKAIVMRTNQNTTSDLSDAVVQAIDELFTSTTKFIGSTFDKWWFANKILSSASELIASFERSKNGRRRRRYDRRRKKPRADGSAAAYEGGFVPGFTSVSSHRFATRSSIRNGLKSTRGIEPQDLEVVATAESEEEEEPDKGQEREEQSKEGPDDDDPRSSAGVAETSRCLETLSEDLFTVQNLSEYFSQDPTFKQFFNW